MYFKALNESCVKLKLIPHFITEKMISFKGMCYCIGIKNKTKHYITTKQQNNDNNKVKDTSQSFQKYM